MGIPSYFKTLTQSVNGCIVKQPSQPAAYLLLDFNCIIYGCLRNMPAYSSLTRAAWEAKLIHEVCEAVTVIWKAAGEPANLFIAVDGVVPMAKIKQQRMRRFKSVWMSAQEIRYGVRSADTEEWDKNAITPGTAFMEALALQLISLGRKHDWTVSTSAEPGEGEHKVMAFLRGGGVTEEGSVIIYGLDADLIVLTMLTSSMYLKSERNPCYLMREKTEFGTFHGFEEAIWLFLSEAHLRRAICGSQTNNDFIVNYVAVMSILGNDFLPTSLTVKIRDGGHERILRLLQEFYGRGERFVVNGVCQWGTFQRLCQRLAADEASCLVAAVTRKSQIKHPAARTENEAKMIPVQTLPLTWFAEEEFYSGRELKEGWQTIYERHVPQAESVREWKYGIQWILDYYLGKPVNLFWFYPWHLAPLWCWLAADISSVESSWCLDVDEIPLKEQEQLALVLPLESWWLIRDPRLRQAPVRYPSLWPSAFGFSSLGKWWMWECEADIPILLPGYLRSLSAT